LGIVVGIDVGGTFTDLCLVDEEKREGRVLKVPSTPADQSIGLMGGLASLGVDLAARNVIVHGTTVATNAVIERKGAKCGLLATEGFRDVVELGRRDRPTNYGLDGFFEPLVSREFRFDIPGRIGPGGEELTPLDEAAVERAGRRLLELGAEVAIVSFMHSYASPVHERAAREVLATFWPNSYIVLSSDVLPAMYEFERTSSAAVNGYVQPIMSRYLRNLEKKLTSDGTTSKLLITQSNGGLMSVDTATRFAVNTVRSGPAAGVIAAAYVGVQAGHPNVVSCDMGGTSLDASLVVDGALTIAAETMIDYRIPVRVPMIDVHTIGAGGGSIAWIDRGGILQVGPQSAGASPGPVAYRRGGTEPTVTDANIVLGRINADRAIGREHGIVMDREASRAAIADRIGRPLGLNAESSAAAIVKVVNATMAGRIRLISVERGHDPRDFALVAFGGGGPLHAAALMAEVNLAAVIVPPFPGIASAFGCVIADFRHDFLTSVNRPLPEIDLLRLEAELGELAAEGQAELDREGVKIVRSRVAVEADVRYVGQRHTLRVPLPYPGLTVEGIAAAFDAVYFRRYGRRLERTPVLVNVHTTVLGERPRLDFGSLVEPKSRNRSNGGPAVESRRPVWFDEAGFVEAEVYLRKDFEVGDNVAGPAVIEQDDTTTVIDPGMVAVADQHGNLVLRMDGSSK
jgi:N-methylhydantoinase A